MSFSNSCIQVVTWKNPDGSLCEHLGRTLASVFSASCPDELLTKYCLAESFNGANPISHTIFKSNGDTAEFFYQLDLIDIKKNAYDLRRVMSLMDLHLEGRNCNTAYRRSIRYIDDLKDVVSESRRIKDFANHQLLDIQKNLSIIKAGIKEDRAFDDLGNDLIFSNQKYNDIKKMTTGIIEKISKQESDALDSLDALVARSDFSITEQALGQMNMYPQNGNKLDSTKNTAKKRFDKASFAF